MSMHVVLTGEIGSGKSTALLRTLSLLPGIRAMGIQTYSSEPRESAVRQLYMRGFAEADRGAYLTDVPGGDAARSAVVFDTRGCELLERARREAQLIVIDEIGRLERDAARYQQALRLCLEGDRPMLCALRMHRAPWADWIRCHERVTLLEVTDDNREQLPNLAAKLLMPQIGAFI